MRTKGLPVVWTKGIAEELKSDFEIQVRNSTSTLSRLYDIIEEKENSINNQEVSISDFDNPSWAYKQAYRNGQKASLKEIKELLAFIKG